MSQPMPERMQTLQQLYHQFTHFTIDVSEEEIVAFFQQAGFSRISNFYSTIQMVTAYLKMNKERRERIDTPEHYREREETVEEVRVQIVREGADPVLDLIFYRPTLTEGQRWERWRIVNNISGFAFLADVNCTVLERSRRCLRLRISSPEHGASSDFMRGLPPELR